MVTIESRAHRIRSVFEDLYVKNGVEGITSREIAEACLDADVFDEDELADLAIRSASSIVSQTLSHKDASGLPVAGTSYRSLKAGHYVWLPREQWTYEDYEWNIRRYVGRRDQSHDTAVLLRDECQKRFGKAPAITGLKEVKS